MISDEDYTKLNILVAYPYLKKGVVDILLSRKSETRFVLDSGAFTAWKKGQSINLDDYCKFIDNLPFRPWRYFTLDVVGDPDATLKNYQKMLDRGYKPIPIFTRGEDISVLDDYYKTSDVVGIGGLVGTQNRKGFVNGIMKKIGKRKCHWLGFTSIEFIKAYRPYMCDSSTYLSGGRFGRIPLYVGEGRFLEVTKKHFLTKPKDKIATALRRHGVSPAYLSVAANWVNSAGPFRNTGFRAWVMFQRDLAKNIGTHLFLATSSATDLQSNFDAYDWMEGKL